MGVKKNIIKENNYKDSVFLMQIAQSVEKLENINAVSIMMATPANKKILIDSKMLTDSGERASENDLIIAIDAENNQSLNIALKKIEKEFESKESSSSIQITPTTIKSAKTLMPHANFALISTPGRYAAREANIALDEGLNVMLFSDNVDIEDEVELKNKSQKLNLLLMGPDCGTAIINGIPLGFANSIPKGNIGIVAASGSGLQEVTVVIAKAGKGITQAIGTGGRDLKKEVGGKTMLEGLKFLKADASTKVIVLISKPPHPDIEKIILENASKTDKPVVVCFLGSPSRRPQKNIFFVDSLSDAGLAAVQLSCNENNEKVELKDFTQPDIEILIENTITKMKKIENPMKYIRGIFAGGTLCYEALALLNRCGIKSYSNVGSSKETLLKDSNKSIEHTLVDMGEDEFTVGTPHPMIDGTLRNKRILKEAEDEQTAVILFDIILGYGSNPNPAKEIEPTLRKIKSKKVLVASVCGTELDPQNYSAQVAILKENGVIVLPTNAQAARFAAEIINVK